MQPLPSALWGAQESAGWKDIPHAHDLQKNRGVTLIEMLVGLLVGLVVVAAAGSIYISTFRGQTNNTKLVRLNQDLRAMMDIMARDIRRAGFVTSDPVTNFSALQSNPFFRALKI